MSVTINQFWAALTASRLLPSAKLQQLFSDYSTGHPENRDIEVLVNWMTEKGALTAYQAEILSSGHAGPFSYGPYQVNDKVNSGPLQGAFKARHARSRFPVLLHFLGGSEPADLQRWKRVEVRTQQLVPIDTAWLTPVFETTVLSEHRMVVSGIPRGKVLSQLPAKSRLPWKHACLVGAQIASALDLIHQRDLVHGSLCDDVIWIDSSGKAQLFPVVGLLSEPWTDYSQLPEALRQSCLSYLAPEVESRDQQNVTGEIYALGCLLVRLIRGRPFCPADTPAAQKKFHQRGEQPNLAKYDLPADLLELIQSMLDLDPAGRPASASAVASLLALQSGKATTVDAGKAPPPEQIALRQQLQSVVTASPVASELPLIQTDEEPGFRVEEVQAVSVQIDATVDKSESDPASRIEAARLARQRRQQNKWKVPAAIAAAVVVFGGLLGGVAYWMSQTTRQTDPVAADTERGTDNPNDSTDGDAGGPTDPGSAVVQTLIADDDQSLWETPTVGPPIDFSYLPPIPRIVLSARGQAMMGSDEGRRVLDAFGPEFQSVLTDFLAPAGIELADCQQLLVSFHEPPAEMDGEQRRGYLPFAVVTLPKPMSRSAVLAMWGQPDRKQTDQGQTFFENQSGWAFYPVVPDDPAPVGDASEAGDLPAGAEANIVKFAFGPRVLLQQSLALPGGIPLSGALEDLVPRTDRDRHLNLLYLRPALFNDRGQAWMGATLAAFNRDLSVLLPDEIQGGLVSFHIDDGNYFELQFDRAVDLKVSQLRERLEAGIRDRRDRLTEFVATVAPNPYWDRVRVKYAGMLADSVRNLRFGVERGQLVVNAWLPPMAAHNLVAASELLATFSDGAARPSESQTEVPATIQALLATPRNLDVANPPDLNVLMADLKREIETDYGQLPFGWDIQLLGADLEAEGITKNQRPGQLKMEQKTLAEILTSIMVSANPAKDISGPEDPNCKLVWVLQPDPENPDKQLILITTRGAAEEKGYALPEAFR